jgi:hypothetical protein
MQKYVAFDVYTTTDKGAHHPIAVGRGIVHEVYLASDVDARIAELLDSREFYELMQAYRHSHVIDQAFVTERFEAVKNFLRSSL